MANLRVVYDNAADRATVVASTTAGSLGVSNLKSDIKSAVWRSTSKTATLTLTWATAELVGCIVLPFCNLTSQATLRVRCYTTTASATPVIDTTQYAAPGATFEGLQWGTEPLGANAYSYGGGTYGVAWFAAGAYQKIVVDITDTTNTANYVEASRLVAGTYWTPVYNADIGASIGMQDSTKNERTDAGDLRSDRGTVHKTMTFDLSVMPNSDRNALFKLMRGNGMHTPVFVSLMPEDIDSAGEQIFQIYGKQARMSAMKYQLLNQYAAQLDIEEI